MKRTAQFLELSSKIEQEHLYSKRYIEQQELKVFASNHVESEQLELPQPELLLLDIAMLLAKPHQ